MTKMVCLANSYKESGRCLAGIDLDTGQWIRPVSRQPGGTLPGGDVQNVGILDVLEITLAGKGPDEGCQPENYFYAGKFRNIGKMDPQDLLRYCDEDQTILHNGEKSIPLEYFNSLPREKWKSLQLIHQTHATFQYTDWPERRKYEARLRCRAGSSLYLPITDPVIRRKLNHDERISQDCIVTVSLATPWKKDDKCYKVVAGVIEL